MTVKIFLTIFNNYFQFFRDFLCPGCEYPMCDISCSTGPIHSRECEILSNCKPPNQPPALQIDRENYEKATNAYAVITPLRLLLLEESNCDQWNRSNQLMDHHTGLS